MPPESKPAEISFGDDNLFCGDEHLRPAWQAVVMTIAMIAASVVVLSLAG